jgi:hypothetical protein
VPSLKSRQEIVEIECHRAGTEESLIAIAGNIVKPARFASVERKLATRYANGPNERPPILSNHLRIGTCIPVNLADLHTPIEEQPSFAHRHRVVVTAAKPLKKRGQFSEAANSTAGQQESTCSQQRAAYLP